MNSVHLTSGIGEHPVVITRVTTGHWHALEDDQVVGRGEVSRRPDGRIFLSIDSWQDAVFDQLADAMLTQLPKPLYTVVDEADLDLTSNWERAGLTIRRREWEYLVPTDPSVTGLGSVTAPSGVTIVAAGAAKEGPLRQVDRAIRAEVEAAVGWWTMPAEVLPRPAGVTVLDPSKYAAAAQSDRYLGLVRLATATRRPRIGLVAVLADQHRRGIARAMLANVLGSLHDSGIATASAEVTESNEAAMALFEGIGARRASSNLELVYR
ncbi:MAG TPA: GNAT family N-acetyltransferase [Pseudonocardiaceae bacterium]|jgi:ribosomal protein S18 acetylase RimI-like enzyme|nr:GNAT family N-acetyltransferase [Pseudonocardiaceae bacterium]